MSSGGGRGGDWSPPLSGAKLRPCLEVYAFIVIRLSNNFTSLIKYCHFLKSVILVSLWDMLLQLVLIYLWSVILLLDGLSSSALAVTLGKGNFPVFFRVSDAFNVYASIKQFGFSYNRDMF